jgi:hypothetical protein
LQLQEREVGSSPSLSRTAPAENSCCRRPIKCQPRTAPTLPSKTAPSAMSIIAESGQGRSRRLQMPAARNTIPQPTQNPSISMPICQRANCAAAPQTALVGIVCGGLVVLRHQSLVTSVVMPKGLFVVVELPRSGPFADSQSMPVDQETNQPVAKCDQLIRAQRAQRRFKNEVDFESLSRARGEPFELAVANAPTSRNAHDGRHLAGSLTVARSVPTTTLPV